MTNYTATNNAGREALTALYEQGYAAHKAATVKWLRALAKMHKDAGNPTSQFACIDIADAIEADNIHYDPNDPFAEHMQ